MVPRTRKNDHENAYRDSSQQELDTITKREVDGETLHTNSDGHAFLSRVIDEIAPVKRDLKDLHVTAEGYFNIRRRFLASSAKKLMNAESREGSDVIVAGNESAHFGDCHSDATFFSMKTKLDPELFKVLYGFSHKQVLKLMDYETLGCDFDTLFGAINTHATIVADKEEHPSKEWEEAFAGFIEAVNKNWLPLDMDDDHTSENGRAYLRFEEAHIQYTKSKKTKQKGKSAK